MGWSGFFLDVLGKTHIRLEDSWYEMWLAPLCIGVVVLLLKIGLPVFLMKKLFASV